MATVGLSHESLRNRCVGDLEVGWLVEIHTKVDEKVARKATERQEEGKREVGRKIRRNAGR